MDVPNPLYDLTLPALQLLRRWLEERHADFLPLIPYVQEAMECKESEQQITKAMQPDSDSFPW